MNKPKIRSDKYDHRKNYAYFHRDLSPADRCKKAFDLIIEAVSLIEDEIDMQASYSQMDYSTIPMCEYKQCRDLLTQALEHCKLR